MKTLRRVAYALLILLILGWCLVWFAGHWLIKRELGSSLTARNVGDIRYEASDFSIGGFPFSYKINMRDAQITQRTDGARLLHLNDQFSVQASLPGTLWNGITGSPIGARIDLSGTHKVGEGLSLTLESAWASITLANLSPSSSLNDLIFAGLNFDMRGLSLALLDQPLASIDRLSLDMDLLRDRPGYAYDFALTGLEPSTPLLTQAPNRLDEVRLQGRIQPDLRAAYAQLLSDLQRNPLEAVLTHGSLIDDLVSSAPGFYLDHGTFVWDEARMQASFDVPLSIQISLSPKAILGLKGEISGTKMGQRLQQLLRDPEIQSSGLALPINGLLIGALSVGMDLDTGTPSTIEGTLLQIDQRSIKTFPGGLEINGRRLPMP